MQESSSFSLVSGDVGVKGAAPSWALLGFPELSTGAGPV